MQRSQTRGWLVTAGAAMFALYVLTHPRGAVERARDVGEAVHSAAVQPAWVPSHLIGLAAVVLIALGLWGLLRAGWLAADARSRRSAWLLLAGAAALAVELVPHTLVAAETGELAAAEGATPLTDLHLLFQAMLVPIYGLGVVALAITGFGRVAHPVACVLGVIGGAALTAVGPLLLITDDPQVGVVFMPGVGTIAFLLATGVRVARGGSGQAPVARQSREPRVAHAPGPVT